jgi:C4-dicarboxylate transporter DctM subunit
MILMPMTFIFSRILVLNGIPALITNLIIDVSGGNKVVILLMVDLILFIAGFFVDATVLQLVLVPLFLPLMAAINVTQTQLAVIMFVSIGVGTITPPMAMNIFIAARLTELDVKDVVPPIWAFVFLLGIPMLLLVTFVPEVSLWLPRLVMGNIV